MIIKRDNLKYFCNVFPTLRLFSIKLPIFNKCFFVTLLCCISFSASAQIRVEAESYIINNGMSFETTTDIGGGQNAGWIDAGDYLNFHVNIPTTGTYRVDYRVASPNSTGSVILGEGGIDLASALVISNTGGWQSWSTISNEVYLEAGAHTLVVYAAAGGWNINWFELHQITGGPDSIRVEAESYLANNGMSFETTTDIGGGQNAGWIDAGDYLDFSVNIPTTGTYRVDYRVASPNSTGSVILGEGGVDLAPTLAIPNTGGWQNWTTISNEVYLEAGAHILVIYAATGGWNINWFELHEVSGGSNGIPAFCSAYPQSGGWQSGKVWYSGGRLQYASDSAGNRIPDYSYAGYHYGVDALPNVPVVSTLGPISGDNTSRIQSALDAIGNRTSNANGHRGALLLSPGRYDVYGTIHIKDSGVVLRGSGDGTNTSTDTIIYARGNSPYQRTPLILGTNSSSPWSGGSSTNVTDSFVPVGSKSFNVQNSGMFSVGQEVIITHPSSQVWINAVGGGGMSSDADWSAGSKDIPYIRKITQISGSRLYFDAPIYNHLDRSLTQATVSAVSGRNLISESGIEDLRVDIETAGGEDENHAWSAIGIIGAEDSWVKNISTRYFGYAGVKTSGAIRITVKDASATNPVGIRTGGRFYNFDVDRNSQLILFTGCHAASGRHNFISNGTTSASGVVWHRCTSSGTNDSEGHRHWSTGMLFDNITGSGLNLKLINRGDWGTSHGWGAAHSTAWNSQATFYVQKPPTAQNYGISGMGSNSTSYPWPGAQGYVDIRSGQTLNPASLYEAQMCDRLEN